MGFQNASRLGRPSICEALGIVGFFFEGETSLVGLEGAKGGVPGRSIGGALHGDRLLVGVGEYVRIASCAFEAELVGRDDAAKELDRTWVGSARINDEGGSGESARSMTSCAQFDIVLCPFRCGGRMETRSAGCWADNFTGLRSGILKDGRRVWLTARGELV